MSRGVEGISFVLLLVFLVYLTSIVLAYFRRWRNEPGRSERFQWHFLVPCCDEEVVIGETLARLRSDFPAAHVWVVDDASDDTTPALVAQWASGDPCVHLVQRFRPNARRGKGEALNAAYEALSDYLPADIDRSAVVVGVVDADGHLDPEVLSYIASQTVMGDGLVGAAQVAVHMRNRDDRKPLRDKGRLANWYSRYLVRMQDVEFRTTIAAMQSLRERTRSVGLGGNGQFSRLSVLDEIARTFGEPWHGSLLEDYELGIHVMLTGYENRYVDETYVSQEAVTSLPRLLTQRTRWAQGNMQCIKYLRDVVRSPHFSSAAVVETGYYLVLPLMQLTGMIVWPIITFYLIRDSLRLADGSAPWLVNSWWMLILTLVCVLPFAMWGPIYKLRCEPRASWPQALLWGIGLFFYIYYVYLCIPRAAYRIMRGESGWAKTRRNSEDLTVGSSAKGSLTAAMPWRFANLRQPRARRGARQSSRDRRIA